MSHDRYFINQTASRILDLTGNTLVNYIGNYDYYLEKREELTSIYAPSSDTAVSENKTVSETSSSNKDDWQKRQNDLKKAEDQIQKLESRDQEIDDLMCLESVYTDVAKCMELNKEKAEIAEKLEALYEVWESLM